MKTIFKYSLDMRDVQHLYISEDAEILTVQTQNDAPCVWALVDSTNELVKRSFEIFGTGDAILGNATRKHIGTFQIRGGLLVFHLFERLS